MNFSLSKLNRILEPNDPCYEGCNIDNLFKLDNSKKKGKKSERAKTTIFHCTQCGRDYNLSMSWDEYPKLGDVIVSSLICSSGGKKSDSRSKDYDSQYFIFLRQKDDALL